MGKTTEMTLDEIAPEDPAARQAEPPIVEAADALPLHSTELRAAIHSSLGPKAAAVLYWERPVHSGASLAALLLLLVGLRFYTLTHILCTFVAGHFLVSMLSNVFSRRLPDSDIRQMMDRMRVDESSERARGIFCAIVSIVNVLIKWYFSVILGRDKLGCSVMFALIAVVWVSSKFLTDLSFLTLGVVLCFVLPNAYETNRAACDAYLGSARDKIEARFGSKSQAAGTHERPKES